MLEFDSPDKAQTVKIVLYPKDGKTAISIAHGVKIDSDSQPVRVAAALAQSGI